MASPRRGPPQHPCLLRQTCRPPDVPFRVASSGGPHLPSPAPLRPHPIMKWRTNPTHCTLQEGRVHSTSAHHRARWFAGKCLTAGLLKEENVSENI